MNYKYTVYDQKQVNVHRSRALDPKHCDGQRNEEPKWVYIAWQNTVMDKEIKKHREYTLHIQQINKQNTIQLKQNKKWNKELKQSTNMQQQKNV